MLACYITSISIIAQKLDGTWNRTIAAGAKPHHFLISHLMEGSIVMAFQLLEYAVYTLFFLTPNLTWNSAILMTLLLLFIGFAGLAFGLLSSIVTSTVLASIIFTQVFVYPASFISGEISVN